MACYLPTLRQISLATAQSGIERLPCFVSTSDLPSRRLEHSQFRNSASYPPSHQGTKPNAVTQSQRQNTTGAKCAGIVSEHSPTASRIRSLYTRLNMDSDVRAR